MRSDRWQQYQSREGHPPYHFPFHGMFGANMSDFQSTGLYSHTRVCSISDYSQSQSATLPPYPISESYPGSHPLALPTGLLLTFEHHSLDHSTIVRLVSGLCVIIVIRMIKVWTIYLKVTSSQHLRSYQDTCRLVTVRTHGNLIVLPH